MHVQVHNKYAAMYWYTPKANAQTLRNEKRGVGKTDQDKELNSTKRPSNLSKSKISSGSITAPRLLPF